MEWIFHVASIKIIKLLKDIKHQPLKYYTSTVQSFGDD